MKKTINLDDYSSDFLKTIISEVYSDLSIERRPYQETIILKTILFIEKYGHSSVLIESPTGSGKTIMALSLAKYFNTKYGYSIGWSTMRRNLLTQVEGANNKLGFNIPIKYISIFDNNPDTIDLRIDDEAHHAVCPSGLALHNKTKPKINIGLTATPFRSDKASLLYNVVLRECNLRRLIKDNYLSSFNYYSIEAWTPKKVSECYLREKEKWGKSIVFFHNEKQCYEFKEIMNKNNLSCEVVTSKTDKEKQIKKFKDGKTRILVNMLILTEGFDDSSVESVFIKPSQKGTTIQMGGRVLRKSVNIPYKNIIQCSDSKNPFFKFAKPTREFIWEINCWNELSTNPKLNLIIQNAIKIRSKKSILNAKKV